MNSPLLKLILLGILISPFPALAQDDEVKARVAISVQQDGETWAGQQVTLDLDVKTTGFSFSDIHFYLPEVPGAFLMQTDTTTVKLSENLDGQTWQILRYPLALYPQKAGQLTIPSIDVRFSTSAGYGSAKKAFEFKTTPLKLTITSPPGLKDGEMIVTTRSFGLDHQWKPAKGPVKTGDALTLTVTRRADGISAMLLPPLPVFRTEGLAAYPQAPDVNDKTNRGSLTGERTDTIIWVVETPGAYDIPGIRLQWWDPAGNEMKRKVIPGLKLEALPPPLESMQTETVDRIETAGNRYLSLLAILLVVLVAVLLWSRYVPKSTGRRVDTEKFCFAALQVACRANHPGQTHTAIHAWLEWVSPALPPLAKPVTLAGFASACHDKPLASELQHLQQALIVADSEWRGAELLMSLRRIRRNISLQKATAAKILLPPLNP